MSDQAAALPGNEMPPYLLSFSGRPATHLEPSSVQRSIPQAV